MIFYNALPIAVDRSKKHNIAQKAPEVTGDGYTLHLGDALDVLSQFADNTFDSLVTDPPYGLGRDRKNHTRELFSAWLSGTAPVIGTRKGVQGADWDAEVPGPELWREAHRVLKPGAHMIAFANPARAHRTATAIDLAGLEIIHTIAWVFGSRRNMLPDQGILVQNELKKARNDKNPNKIKGKRRVTDTSGGKYAKANRSGAGYLQKDVYEITYPEAMPFEGYRARMTDAHVQIIVARKKKAESSLAKNLIKHGVGALNVGGCPDPETGNLASTFLRIPLESIMAVECDEAGPVDSSAFLPEGEKNLHPCAKPIDLMRWLTRLVTPENGLVLNPFSGSGTGGVAALFDGYRYVGIEREHEYFELGRKRVEGAWRFLNTTKETETVEPANDHRSECAA